MMSYFQFDQNNLLTFFVVFMRMSVLFAVIPFLGAKTVPVTVKVLLSLCVSYVIFPTLISQGWVHPEHAQIWSQSASSLVSVITLEVVFGLLIGYTAKLFFDVLQIGGDIVGTFMGFASASMVDPLSDSQTQVVAQFHVAFGVLLFLTFDGHHIMLKALMDSFRIVGLGKVTLGKAFSENIIHFTGDVLKISFQMAAPMALSMFAVNVVYGVIAKAMPQLNILILSFAVSALIGILVLFISIPEYSSLLKGFFQGMGTSLETMMVAVKGN